MQHAVFSLEKIWSPKKKHSLRNPYAILFKTIFAETHLARGHYTQQENFILGRISRIGIEIR